MGRVCREVQEWIEEEIEQPIEEWGNGRIYYSKQQSAKRMSCRWF